MLTHSGGTSTDFVGSSTMTVVCLSVPVVKSVSIIGLVPGVRGFVMVVYPGRLRDDYNTPGISASRRHCCRRQCRSLSQWLYYSVGSITMTDSNMWKLLGDIVYAAPRDSSNSSTQEIERGTNYFLGAGKTFVY